MERLDEAKFSELFKAGKSSLLDSNTLFLLEEVTFWLVQRLGFLVEEEFLVL